MGVHDIGYSTREGTVRGEGVVLPQTTDDCDVVIRGKAAK